MSWNEYGGDINTAMESIPKDTGKDEGYSTPDVYGRAAQLYLSLKTATTQGFQGEDVLMWRGMLAMLALRNIRSLPLRWERNVFQQGNPLSNAMSHPPKEVRQLLYPDEREYQWDGSTLTFYALTWEPTKKDLAIYSPMTLLYPVADWRKEFAAIPELNRFFDAAEHKFRDCTESLQSGDLKIIYLWLQAMINHLYGKSLEGAEDNNRRNYRGTDSEAKGIIRQHLDAYLNDLERKDRSLRGSRLNSLEWKHFPEYTSVTYLGLPETLIAAYGIPGPPLFADQICYFKVKHEDGPDNNPFAFCNYADNYRISGTLDSRYDLYAFLPVHPEWRKDCFIWQKDGLPSGIVENMRMEVAADRNDPKKHYIRASTKLNVLGDFPLEQEYVITDENENISDKQWSAVCYKVPSPTDPSRKNVANITNWPLISVWPNIIETGWNEYYVMRSERSAPNGLRIYHEMPWKAGPNPDAALGSNMYAVKTSYVPDAIPFVREYTNSAGGKKEKSVGMVTPMISSPQGGQRAATVAVDFGTTSTRIFYRLDANPDDIREIIPFKQDRPLQVTAYEDDDTKCEEMGKFFISPRPPFIATGNSLLSIFRKSGTPQDGDNVLPILDGVIYHPEKHDTDDFDVLVTNLKWNGDREEPYYIAFMKQLCIHVMSILYREKGINVIHWTYALPRAMEQERGGTDRVRNIWNNLGEFLSLAGKGTVKSDVTQNPMTESVAASRFFATYRMGEVNKKKGYLVVDIGGGTTDVALWWSKDGVEAATLQWHSSVKVAGREMFTNWIEKELGEILSDVSNGDMHDLIGKIEHPNRPLEPETKAALVDRMLSSYSNDLKDLYLQKWTNRSSAWADRLCNQITQSATLLMFCLGYQVGVLMQAHLYEVRDEDHGFFAIAVAGRGSLMWDWLLNCKDDKLHEFFKEGVRAAGAEWPDSLRISIVRDRKDPKATVGQGLLVSTRNLDKSAGWGSIENTPELEKPMDDVYYYNQAAERFLSKYAYAFKDYSAKLDIDKLSGFAQHAQTTRDDAFKVLMKAIYGYLKEPNNQV